MKTPNIVLTGLRVIWSCHSVDRKIEDISEDFAIWRVFYGPLGGEVPA